MNRNTHAYSLMARTRCMVAPLLALTVVALVSVPTFGLSHAQGSAHRPHAPHTAPIPHPLQPASQDRFTFPMVRSTAAVNANCLSANAVGVVTISRTVQNDVMDVQTFNLPPNTDFDFFVTQLPDKPFGVAWYQSDLHTDVHGHGHVDVVGIFNAETFSVSQGGPRTGTATGATTAVTDTNVTFQPTSQYHLGLWFNNPADAAAAGCPNTVTPFNGEQNAGIQALSTRNFPADLGPLAAIRP